MTRKGQLISTAVTGLIALGTLAVSTGAVAADGAAKEKCYGIAKAGQNDCASKAHGCQGQAKNDNDPGEWKYVAKGECAAAGGSTEPGKQGS
ncbi:hypothetical protein GPROT2_03653 [Gammaproteobacteria bacterium]|nr:DUF2282 domain-containing protein [Gammaproteobacteria bacterium]QOJ30912.1 MAG: DUF2282 domain-containing protein [Gammaproteobacteria bacterium]CAG0946269.1 hypothetical protein GPROT2_03653 [Gammaproteobacteria bacterium]